MNRTDALRAACTDDRPGVCLTVSDPYASMSVMLGASFFATVTDKARRKREAVVWADKVERNLDRLRTPGGARQWFVGTPEETKAWQQTVLVAK